MWHRGEVVVVAGSGALTSRVVKLALRQASRLHHGATRRLGGAGWHARREGGGLAIGILLVGERGVGWMLQPGLGILVRLCVLRGMRGC